MATGTWAAPWPSPAARPLYLAGALLFLGGAAQVGAGILALGEAFHPLLRPDPKAELRTGGVLARARHPIYGGWMLAGLGWALASSPWSLVPALVLVAELDGKRRVEERWLVERYPDYPAYRSRVPRCYLVVP